MTRRRGTVVALAAGLGMASVASVAAAAPAGVAAAAPAAIAPQQYALLICNADYDRDGRITPAPPPDAKFMNDLVRPCRDLATVEAALAAYDFKVFKHADVDRAGVDAAFRAFARQVAALPPRSTVFVYYAGHGAQYDGEVYGVPVLYQPGAAADARDFRAKRQFLLRNATPWSTTLGALPDRADLSVAIVIDACRNNPFAEATIYNESSVPRGANNEYVFWATNGGNTTSDSGALARIVADAFRRGGTISEVMSTIWRRDGDLVDRGRIETEGEPWTGRNFAFQQQPVLRRSVVPPPAAVAVAPPPPPAVPVAPPPAARPVPPAGRAAELARLVAARPAHAPVLKTVAIGDGLRLDVFVCQGERQLDNLGFAEGLADDLRARGAALGVGSVRVRYLTDALNDAPGYRVRVNLMRYDVPFLRGGATAAEIRDDAREKATLGAIARAYPAANFLPAPGVGVNGRRTAGYVSAFVCGRVVEPAA